jgi:two-component system CheB/CheR fusion protein
MKSNQAYTGMKTLIPTCVVGIGGSAGALNAYKTLLDNLPTDTGMALVIISHLNPDAYSQLAQILARHTMMPALVASAGMPISANHVYVIPANADLEVEKYKFKVISPRSRRNAQIDLFFASIAEAFADRAIGVILSGYDGDGTAGCRQIKEGGGITFAQDESAEVDAMPVSAQASSYVDFVLPPDKISSALVEIGLRFARIV